MKTSLKILHKVPDLDELAARHQNFDALMDAHTDEKIRRRKKFYKAGSFVMVIMATAFLSWLYWGYEPVQQQQAAEQSEKPKQQEEQVMLVEEKEQVQESESKPPVRPAPVVEKPKETITDLETEVTTQKAEVAEKEPEVEEMASPKITIREKITADAEPIAGLEDLYRYLYKEIDLPDSLLEADNTLFLEIEFVVEADGEIGAVSFNKNLPGPLESKLSKVFAEMPAWKPALEKGDSVASIINLPITFQKKEDKR